MSSGQQTHYQDHIRILRSSLRQVRIEVDQTATADTIHTLRNGIATAQGALGVVETRLAKGLGLEDIDALLDVAERRLRETRALLAHSRRVSQRRYWTLLAA